MCQDLAHFCRTPAAIGREHLVLAAAKGLFELMACVQPLPSSPIGKGMCHHRCSADLARSLCDALPLPDAAGRDSFSDYSYSLEEANAALQHGKAAAKRILAACNEKDGDKARRLFTLPKLGLLITCNAPG